MKKYSFEAILALLTLFSGTFMYRGASIGESLAFVSIAGLLGFYKYLEHNKAPDVSEELRQELSEIKSQMSGLFLKEVNQSKSWKINKR